MHCLWINDWQGGRYQSYCLISYCQLQRSLEIGAGSLQRGIQSGETQPPGRKGELESEGKKGGKGHTQGRGLRRSHHLVLGNVEDVALCAAEHDVQCQGGRHVEAHAHQQDPKVVRVLLGVELRHGGQCTPAVGAG